MEQFSAAAVYEMARTFEQLRATCNLIERFGKVKFSGSEIVPDQMESIELLPARTRMELPPEWQKSVLKILTAVEQHCEYIGLKLSTQAARDARVELESGRIKTYSDASEAFGALDKIIQLQLRENLFMIISPERAAFYSKPQLFGEA